MKDFMAKRQLTNNYVQNSGRNLLSFIDVCKETKERLECYMTTSTSGIKTNRISKPRS